VVGRGPARWRSVASRARRKAGKSTTCGGGGAQEGWVGSCAWGRRRRGWAQMPGRARHAGAAAHRKATDAESGRGTTAAGEQGGEWGAGAEGGLRMGARTPRRGHRGRPGVEGSEGRDRPPTRGGEAAGAAGLGARAARDLSAWSEPARRLIWWRRSHLR
jgi:hypothetical protein